jgi:cytochrome b involved in lipid metabolism
MDFSITDTRVLQICLCEFCYRHPGYSLFEWRKLCESGALSERQTLHVNLDDISKHNTEEDCWTAIRGKVYNVTRFLKYHPGRKAQLMRGAGVDCTELFDKAPRI